MPFLRAGRALCPALLVSLLFVSSANGQTTQTCDGKWRVYSSNLRKSGNSLGGAAVLNTHDAWAVGDQQSSNGVQDPLIEHWDGSKWSLAANPDLPGQRNELTDVDALTADDAWAVGFSYAQSRGSAPLLMHWDGSTWTVVPGASGVQGSLQGVDMIAADDVWAVGEQEPEGRARTLAEHWDGSSWTLVPTPNPNRVYDFLFGVSGTSSSNVLAAGYRRGPLTLLEQWDGARWQVVRVRHTGTLYGVWLGRGNIVAAGPPVLRSDDASWITDSNPEPAATFYGVSGRTSDDGVWAVGSRKGTGRYPYAETAMIRWTGTRWIAAPAPSPGTDTNVLNGVAASEPAVWAVGYTEGKSVIPKALILGVC